MPSTRRSPLPPSSGSGSLLAGPAGRFAARLGASLLALVTGVVLGWALLAKAIPALDPGGDRVARLREPVGYWNALALLADIAIVLGLWLGTSRGHRAHRARRRRAARVCGDALAAAHALAGRCDRGGGGRRALARALERARRGRAPARGLGGPGSARRRRGRSLGPRSSRTLRCARTARPTARSSACSRSWERLVVRCSPRSASEVGHSARRHGAAPSAAGSLFGCRGCARRCGRCSASAPRARSRPGARLRGGRERSRPLRLARERALCWWGEAWDVFAGHAPGGRRRRLVRGRPQALPPRRAQRRPAPQRAAAAAGRRRDRRARALSPR